MIVVLLHAILFAQGQVGGGWEVTHRYPGVDDDWQFGWNFAGIGDVDGDSCQDFVLGQLPSAPWNLDLGTFVVSGKTQLPILELVNPANVSLGSAVAAAGDLDRDGVPDVIVSGVGSRNPLGHPEAGTVVVFSGADGRILLEIFGESPYVHLGYALVGDADFNGDGVVDLVVGTPEQSNSPHQGHCRVYSGADGSILHEIAGTVPYSGFAYVVDVLGDWDGDGRPEFAFCDFTADGVAGPEAGAILVHSGATGTLLHTFEGPAAQSRLGYSFGNAGDVDADGIPDLVAGLPGYRANGRVAAGAVAVYSGRTRTELLRIEGENFEDSMGWSVAGAGDQDGDARADLVVGVPFRNVGPRDAGAALIVSGANGALLHRVEGDAFDQELGRKVGRAGNLDGHGPDHLFVWVPGADSLGFEDNGELRVYALEPYLEPSAAEISAAQGADVILDMDFPDDAGWAYYQVLVSSSGVGPTRLWGLDVPLSGDGWYQRSLAGAVPGGALGFAGFLSAEGQAVARLTVAPGQVPAGMVGATLWIAAVARDLGGAGLYASMARSFLVAP